MLAVVLVLNLLLCRSQLGRLVLPRLLYIGVAVTNDSLEAACGLGMWR